MQNLIERIRDRLQRRAYVNEAAISHGVVMPIIAALGWDTADPGDVVPEYSIANGRVDFALFGLGHKPAVFIEVKQVGHAMTADKQLFEYAFNHGVPLCVLTDGREWSFYLPSGIGSFEDRRLYRLQLDDREPEKCEQVLTRYLARERVRSGTAFEDAQRDHRDAAQRREAVGVLPRAWRELAAEANDQILEALTDKAEALCGYKPAQDAVITFLRSLSQSGGARPLPLPASSRTVASGGQAGARDNADKPEASASSPASIGQPKTVNYTLFGQERSAPNASVALVEILSAIVARDTSKLPELAAAVSGSKVNHIATSAEAINPAKPHLARGAPIAPGWLVGLNIANRTKIQIIRAACEVYGVEQPAQLSVRFPNAN